MLQRGIPVAAQAHQFQRFLALAPPYRVLARGQLVLDVGVADQYCQLGSIERDWFRIQIAGSVNIERKKNIAVNVTIANEMQDGRQFAEASPDASVLWERFPGSFC